MFAFSLDQALKQLAQKEIELNTMRAFNEMLMEKVAQFEAKEEEILRLSQIIAKLPGNVYWKNKEGIYLGCNENCWRLLGFQSSNEIVGKNIFDILGPDLQELAKATAKNDAEILSTEEHKIFEERA